MKILKNRFWLVPLLVVMGCGAQAALAPFDIPDGGLNGVSDTFTVSTPYSTISSLRVVLNISGVGGGGYNGDLYLTLTHGDGYAVLLNRVGRRTGSGFGYGDSGFSQVVLDDNAAGGDVHVYRQTFSGSHAFPLAGPLTGTYQPDGRPVDPDTVLDTDLRTAMLSSFLGLNPNGSWTLFAADVSSGGMSRVEDWALEVNGEIIPVPEASTFIAGALLLLPLLLQGARALRKRKPSGAASA